MTNPPIFHDSRNIAYRRPSGAVPRGTAVCIYLDIEENPSPNDVKIRLWSTSAKEDIMSMGWIRAQDGMVTYGSEFTTPDVPGLLWYHFIIEYSDRTVLYGAPSDGQGGEGTDSGHDSVDWQITVYDPDIKIPDWYTNGIMYQIFVDRFFRGNRESPLPDLHPGSVYHPHWEDRPFYAKDPKTGDIAAYDFFGGTLEGVLDKLPYLKSLGVTVLYLNPIFESVSNHKYDTADYLKIDPQFGDEKFFSHFCEAAGVHGMRVILDGVFSHTGADSLYFKDALKSKDSQYYSWYRFTRYPEKYESWWGVTTLPNVNEMDPAYRSFIISGKDSVIKHWLKAGAAGWRLDVVDELPDPFVQEMFREMKQTYPEAVLVGEVWEDASHKMSYGVLREYLWGHELDSVINYPFRKAILDFLVGDKDSIAAIRALASLAENYPAPYLHSAMNVIGSHDVVRALTLLGQAPAEESLTKLEQARYDLPPAARQLALARLRLAALIQFCFPGIPCVYYGDEAGLEGYPDPQNRRPYPWGSEESTLIDWYRRLGALRHEDQLLRTGRWVPLEAAPDILGFGRRTDEGRDALGKPCLDAAAVVLVNRSDTEVVCEVEVKSVCEGPLADALDVNDLFISDREGRLKLTISPLSAKILRAGLHSLFSLRSAGVLLHPTSLPGPCGIGDLGPQAYKFVDWLAAAGQTFWQVLPLNPVDFSGSPYQSDSAFAGNFLLISPELLEQGGLIRSAAPPAGFSAERVEYEKVTAWKNELLREAFESFRLRPKPDDYNEFLTEASSWLEGYVGYKSKKGQGLPDFTRFVQYVFFDQWRKLHAHAASLGIRIIGDLPIFVAHDSADVWEKPDLFNLDAEGLQLTKAGVPPDCFSRTGQLWGNPHYDWERHKAEDFAWWRERMRWLYTQVDAIRIDHFCGFEAYWEIAASEKTAIHGRWVKGPGKDLFCSLRRHLGETAVLAEDLGCITPEVTALKEAFFFPGMTVLQFSLFLEDGVFQQPAPAPNSFFYTGTHDNDTLFGWLKQTRKDDPDLYRFVAEYAGVSQSAVPGSLVRPLVGAVMESEARTVIIPLQDWLGLDNSARMNKPGTVAGNWAWRVNGELLTPELAREMEGLTRAASRVRGKGIS